MSTFSPSEAALEGFRLSRERPGAILAWSGVYFLGIMLIAGVMMLGIGQQFIVFLRDDSLQSGDPAAVARFGEMLAKSWPAFIVALVIAVFVLAVLTGGMYRLVLRPQERGFAHLRLGADEVRLAATHFLLVLIGVGALLLVEVVLQLAQRAVGGLFVSLLALVGVALMTWMGVRLSLATPYAFAEKRISLRGAWEMTQGKFWRLLAMILLSLLFYIMIWVLFAIISYVIAQLAGGQQAVMAMTKPSVMVLFAFVVIMAIQLLLPILQAVMVYAPFAVAYRQLRDS